MNAHHALHACSAYGVVHGELAAHASRGLHGLHGLHVLHVLHALHAPAKVLFTALTGLERIKKFATKIRHRGKGSTGREQIDCRDRPITTCRRPRIEPGAR